MYVGNGDKLRGLNWVSQKLNYALYYISKPTQGPLCVSRHALWFFCTTFCTVRSLHNCTERYVLLDIKASPRILNILNSNNSELRPF